jgi:hypothetical protein
MFSMPDKNGSNLGGTGESITISDLIAILNLILANKPTYVDKWNVIAKGKVKSSILTNIWGNKITLKAESNLLIENLGDRVTIYDIEAYFIDDCKKQRISATNLLINTNSCKKNDFIVLDKGDVILINIIAVLQCHNKDFSLQSLKNLELIFSGTSSSKNKIFPLQD